MVEAISSKNLIKCIFRDGIYCYCKYYICNNNKDCIYRIKTLENLVISHKFSDASFKINIIPYEFLRRSYTTFEDFFTNPHIEVLREVKFSDPEKKGWIRFNIFNIQNQEYFYEIFEIKMSELHNFIWNLEEFGYSDYFKSKFTKNILENMEE